MLSTKDKLALIVELTKLLQKSPHSLDIFSEITNISRDTTGADRCSLYIYDKTKKHLFTKIAHGLVRSIEVKIGEGVAGSVAKTKKSIILGDAYASSLFNPLIDAETGYKTKSLAAVPIIGPKQQLYGVLQALNKTEGEFDEEDIGVLIILGELAASVMANTKMVQELSKQVEQKTKKLKQLNESLKEQIDAQVTELRIKDNIMFRQSKNAATGQMIGMIAHQWRQPLTQISAIASKIKLRSMLKQPIMIEEDMEYIISSAKYLSETIDDFRNFFRPDKKMTSESVAELISSSLKFSANLLHTSGIEVTVLCDEHLRVNVYKNEIVQAALNIVSNAADQLKHKQEAMKKIAIEAGEDKKSVYIKVSDNGGGFGEGVAERLFDEYFTTKGDNGTGLGLYMSRLIIEQNHHGELKAYNNDIGGATFEIRLKK